jgi:hypothetical protein
MRGAFLRFACHATIYMREKFDAKHSAFLSFA